MIFQKVPRFFENRDGLDNVTLLGECYGRVLPWMLTRYVSVTGAPAHGFMDVRRISHRAPVYGIFGDICFLPCKKGRRFRTDGLSEFINTFGGNGYWDGRRLA